MGYWLLVEVPVLLTPNLAVIRLILGACPTFFFFFSFAFFCNQATLQARPHAAFPQIEQNGSFHLFTRIDSSTPSERSFHHMHRQSASSSKYRSRVRDTGCLSVSETDRRELILRDMTVVLRAWCGLLAVAELSGFFFACSYKQSRDRCSVECKGVGVGSYSA